MPWRSWFVRADGAIAAQARVELVLVDLSAGEQRRRLRRRLPDDLAAAVAALERGPQ
jgi:acyl-CoA thioester hydrolase